MLSCRYGHESVVKCLLGSEKVSVEHVDAKDKVSSVMDSLNEWMRMVVDENRYYCFDDRMRIVV